MELTEHPQRPADQAASATPAGGGWAARLTGLLVDATPTIAFLVFNGLYALDTGLIAAGATAAAVFGWRVLRRQRLRSAVIGLAVLAVCAAVAAFTGQARGFFLIPALFPFAVVIACVGGFLAGWPLTGVFLNKISGGPADWREIPRLRRVYVVSTWVVIALDTFNAVLQVIYYSGNKPVVLGVVHIFTGPVFAVVFGLTVTFARRAMPARQKRADIP